MHGSSAAGSGSHSSSASESGVTRGLVRVAWVSSWTRVCGIADYSQVLWPEVRAALERRGIDGELVSLDEFKSNRDLSSRLRDIRPDLVHFQHEYGIWGGKNPPFYRFPQLIHQLRDELPRARFVATAHTVLSPDYRFPVKGRGLQAPIRALANAALLGRLRRAWGKDTWGRLDGVITHSKHLVESVQASGVPRVEVIPHFVPVLSVPGTVARGGPASTPGGEARVIIVFGFFTPEKGQDIAIEALGKLPDQGVKLILAGGVRRKQDQRYLDQCRERILDLGLRERVEITGFVKKNRIDSYYQRATLVLVPFRSTTGSGSIAHALGRGMPILASDLSLNREIADREPGALEFFRSEDAESCAHAISSLLGDAERRKALGAAARRYAAGCSPAKVAEDHVRFYQSL